MRSRPTTLIRSAPIRSVSTGLPLGGDPPTPVRPRPTAVLHGHLPFHTEPYPIPFARLCSRVVARGEHGYCSASGPIRPNHSLSEPFTPQSEPVPFSSIRHAPEWHHAPTSHLHTRTSSAHTGSYPAFGKMAHNGAPQHSTQTRAHTHTFSANQYRLSGSTTSTADRAVQALTVQHRVFSQ